jgi:uncharacterized membrane protein YfcA
VSVVSDPWFYVLALPAVMLTGISKGGLGGGAAGVAVPLLALVISPRQAAAIMLPILCIMDLPAIHAYFGRWDRRQMRIIVPGGLLGIVIGTLTFRYLDDNWIRLLLGVIAIGFVASSLRKANPAAQPPSKAKGWFWSGLSGFTSFVAHAGGPPFVVYMLPQKLDKTVFVATSIIFFAICNFVKIGPYLWLELFDGRNIATSALLAPVAIFSTYLGLWLHKYITQTAFYRIIYVLLGASGMQLLYSGLTRLA